MSEQTMHFRATPRGQAVCKTKGKKLLTEYWMEVTCEACKRTKKWKSLGHP